MKIKDLKIIIENVDSNSDIAVSVERNGKDSAMAVTYDIGYCINEYGELILSVAVFDVDFEQ